MKLPITIQRSTFKLTSLGRWVYPCKPVQSRLNRGCGGRGTIALPNLHGILPKAMDCYLIPQVLAESETNLFHQKTLDSIAKGQLISKANSKLFIWTQKPTIFFCISALASKSGRIKKIYDKYMINGIKLVF
jgi:hypothetical protein